MRLTLNDGIVANKSREIIPRIWLFAPLLLATVLLMLENTGMDRAVSHWFFDAGVQGFPLRNTFFLDMVMHHWAKYLVILVTCTIATRLALTYVIPSLRKSRRLLLFVFLAMTLAPLTVTALKQVTDRPCPWDLIEFGGNLPYTRLFETRDQPHAQGLCFPAGHASTGFALMAFFFAAHLEHRRTLARAALTASVLAGITLGIGRIAQGAHFVSHVLWSGLVCWMVMICLYALVMAPDKKNRLPPQI